MSGEGHTPETDGWKRNWLKSRSSLHARHACLATFTTFAEASVTGKPPLLFAITSIYIYTMVATRPMLKALLAAHHSSR